MCSRGRPSGSASEDGNRKQCGPGGGRPSDVAGAGQQHRSVSLPNPFSFHPLCGLGSAKTLDWKQLGRPLSGLLTPAATLMQLFFPLPASVASRALKARAECPDVLLVPCKRAGTQPPRLAAFVAFIAQSLSSCFPALFSSCLRELAWRLSGQGPVILCSH